MAAVMLENVPATQIEHEVDPEKAQVPVPHDAHAEALIEPVAEVNVPAAHGEHDADPADDHVPARQLLHVEAVPLLTTVENVPAGHEMHVETVVALGREE